MRLYAPLSIMLFLISLATNTIAMETAKVKTMKPIMGADAADNISELKEIFSFSRQEIISLCEKAQDIEKIKGGGN